MGDAALFILYIALQDPFSNVTFIVSINHDHNTFLVRPSPLFGSFDSTFL